MNSEINNLKLRGKAALITGGSRGIGFAVAQAFLRHGAKVIVAARNQKGLFRAAKGLRALGRCVPFSADVSRPEEARLLIQKSLAEFGVIDILVNAAAVINPIGPFFQNDLAEWRRSLEINLLGPVNMIYYILPHFLERRQGKIINFSGGGATRGRPRFSSYAAAKAAIVRLTEILGSELKEYNIQVNAIAPGIVATNMVRTIVRAGPEKAGREYWDLFNRQKNDFDSAEFACRLAVFLASPEGDRITGKIISARWDDWTDEGLIKRMTEDDDFFVLRRIDGREFIKREK